MLVGPVQSKHLQGIINSRIAAPGLQILPVLEGFLYSCVKNYASCQGPGRLLATTRQARHAAVLLGNVSRFLEGHSTPSVEGQGSFLHFNKIHKLRLLLYIGAVVVLVVISKRTSRNGHNFAPHSPLGAAQGRALLDHRSARLQGSSRSRPRTLQRPLCPSFYCLTIASSSPSCRNRKLTS